MKGFLLAVPLLAALTFRAGDLLGQATGSDGPSLQAFVFGDIVYAATERDVPDGFDVGQVVGHAAATLSDRLTFFSEVSVTGRSSGYSLEVERVILRYDFGDRLKLSAGRYHTPIMYWNTAFHHGSWLQTSVDRPRMIRFGSRFLPVHFVGALAEGGFPGSALGLSYQVGVGNGRAGNIARAGDDGDVNDAAAFVASLTAQPSNPFGLRFGASAYVDRVTPDGGTETDERIYSLHAVWERGAPEVLAEYVRVDHDPLDGGPDEASDAFYAQAGLRLPYVLAGLKPYIRYEQMELPSADPVFSGLVDDYRAALVGLRFDFDFYGALKTELRREEFGTEGWSTSLFVQASFAIPALGADRGGAR